MVCKQAWSIKNYRYVWDVSVLMVEVTRMQPYLAYMINKTLTEDVIEARRIMQWSKAFVVVKGELYKKSISGVLQRCITPQKGQAILHDIHAGVCYHHASSRVIAAKAFWAGFYWLTVVEDAKDILWWCEACQRFASRPHAQQLNYSRYLYPGRSHSGS
jgi:hypothetical protein